MLIGISGRAGSGKDSLARFLEAYGTKTLHFADPLYDGLRAMLGLTDADFSRGCKEQPISRLGGKSPRALLQTLGTEWGRNMVDARLWISEARRRYALAMQSCAAAVFADVRFDDEADWIRSLGGKVVHIVRHDAAPVRAHVSEAGVVRCESDLVIYNGGSLDDLRSMADDLASRCGLVAAKIGEAA